jgi:isopenicillin N synthase-like dioxygenase
MTTTPSEESLAAPPPTVTPVLLDYPDLVAFVQDANNNTTTADAATTTTTPTPPPRSSLTKEQKELMIAQIGKAFGPDGLGILGVTNVPHFTEQRTRLLQLAPQLPTLPDLSSLELPHTQYSTGWSHGREQLGPNQPDYAKGSFYANPWVDSLVEYLAQQEEEHQDQQDPNDTLETRKQYWYQQRELYPSFYADNVWPHTTLPQLRTAFMELGQSMMHVGAMVACVCDAYCQSQGLPSTNLYQTLLHSRNSKGRLLHYFDMSQQKQKDNDTTNAQNHKEKDNDDMWCGWHNDHGSLTCLAPGMFCNAQGQQVLETPAGAGLYVQTRAGQMVRVQLPSTVCGFQIGETSQIQTGGLLQATPHAVKSGTSSIPGITRESFAVFLEPHFDEPLTIPSGRTLEQCQEVTKVVLPPTVRPLRDRWQPGQTFGDFHMATIAAFATE